MLQSWSEASEGSRQAVCTTICRVVLDSPILMRNYRGGNSVRALLTNPQQIVLDEWTPNLDSFCIQDLVWKYCLGHEGV